MPRVVDGFMRGGWKFIYGLVVTYLVYLKERLMMSGDQAEFLECLSSKAGREMGESWEELVETSEKVKL